MARLALITAGVVFLLVAIMHLLRLIFKVEVKVKNYIVPTWVSTIGFVFTLVLSLWMFKAS